MKILFAMNNEKISNAIIDKYTQMFYEKLEVKNVYYFKALLEEVKKDKTYDRVVIYEELEPFVNNNFEAIDQYLFNKIDGISDELEGAEVIFVASERRTKADKLLKRFFSLGIYNMLIGKDRNIEAICKIINKPRTKKEAKEYIDYGIDDVYARENTVDEVELQRILLHFKKLGEDTTKYIESFDRVSEQYNAMQMKIICNFLPINVKKYLNSYSAKYREYISISDEVQMPQIKVEEVPVPEVKTKRVLVTGKLENNKKEEEQPIVEKKPKSKALEIEIPDEPVIKVVEKKVPVEKIVEKEVVKEVIREVPVDRIVEKEVVKEVIREVPVDRIVEKQVIKEVPVIHETEKETIRQVFEVPKDYSKAVCMVGASKVGTSFMINAIAYMLSKNGIKTAILDMTRERNMYYIYTKNNDNLRRKAEVSIMNVILNNNTNDGIEINKNLYVYTSVPGTDRKSYNHIKLMERLKMDFKVVLIDCDFTTPVDYYKLCREIYVVQDMDILTVQQITTFMRELKSKDINLSKIHVIINKLVKSNVTGKKLMEGLAYYYDPQMTYVDELLDPRMNYFTVPFNEENYSKYINNLFACDMDFSNFTTEFLEMIGVICNVLYPTSEKMFGKRKFSLFRKR